jgi:hypothetical protein
MPSNPPEQLCDIIASKVIEDHALTFEEVDRVLRRQDWLKVRIAVEGELDKHDPAVLGIVIASGKSHPCNGASLYSVLQGESAYAMADGREQLNWLAFGAVVARMHEILHRAT